MDNTTPVPAPTSPQNERLIAVIAYLGWFVTAFVILLIEKRNTFIRFHAMQSLITFGVIFVLAIVFSYLPILKDLIQPLIVFGGVLLWLFLMYQAYLGKMYKLPYIGQIAQNYLGKF
jgi:uncharacterized membrane protein